MWLRQCLMRVNVQHRVAGSFSSTSSGAPCSVTLYQYAICPFCNKAKALLAYAGIQPTVVEVNPLTKAELKPWSGDYKKVPIALIDGKQVNGSDEIMSAVLENPHVVDSMQSKWTDMTLDDFASSPSALHWSKFANDELAPLLYPNLCRSLSDSYQAFSYVNNVDNFSAMQKVAIRGLGSVAMYLAASKVKSKRGITDERQALNDALTTWEQDGLGDGKLFASGKQDPNMGDLTVFGTLRAVEGMPVHAQVIKQREGVLPEWYERMKEQVYSS